MGDWFLGLLLHLFKRRPTPTMQLPLLLEIELLIITLRLIIISPVGLEIQLKVNCLPFLGIPVEFVDAPL